MTTTPDEDERASYSDTQIARVAHDVNAAIRQAEGDHDVAHWDDLPADGWQRVDSLRQVRLLRQDPGLTPEADHEAWRLVRMEQGWTHGVVRDPQQKTSPLLVPWGELPFRHRARSEAGFEVIRILSGLDNGAGAAAPGG